LPHNYSAGTTCTQLSKRTAIHTIIYDKMALLESKHSSILPGRAFAIVLYCQLLYLLCIINTRIHLYFFKKYSSVHLKKIWKHFSQS